VGLVRVVGDLLWRGATDVFNMGALDTVVLLTYEMLYIALTFSLVLLISRRLLAALQGDIAEREETERALRKSEEKFRVAFETVPDAIIITRLGDGTIVEANDGYETVTGFTKDESLGRTTLELGLWTDVADRELFVGKLVSHGSASDVETVVRRKSGETFPAVLCGEMIELDGEPTILTVFEDATARKLAESQLKELSDRDALTGLLNHRAFYAAASDRIEATRDSWIALVFMDLDRLKNVNDEHGHPAGDQALIAYAEALRGGFRESDIIGRLGGDEFAVVAVSRERVADEMFLARYLRSLAKLNAGGGMPFEVQASVGVVWREPGKTEGIEELIGIADARMYAAKRVKASR
jgi:diguanylate cyclase (GGDEF)-like protein/PAS domain S-box-containing protein